jgi:hypothetical protein
MYGEKSMSDMATRIANAEESFIDVLMELGGITKTQAVAVSNLYRKARIAKLDPINGVIRVQHGAFLDRSTIQNAVLAARPTGYVKPINTRDDSF